MIRAVIDTNVLFEGLSYRGAPGRILDAWAERRFVPCVSTALALEVEEVLASRFSATRRPTVLAALTALLGRAEYIPVLSRVRPLSHDPDDDFVIECAFNADALLVTQNLRDLKVAQTVLGIPVLNATAFLTRLSE